MEQNRHSLQHRAGILRIMENEQKHSESKSRQGRGWLKWAIVLLVIVLFAGGVRLLLKSDWLFDKVKEITVKQVNEQLNGTITIDEIRGDLLSGFTIYGIDLKDYDSNDLASIDSVAVSYRLMSLIRSTHILDELRLNGAELYITQDEDSLWNVMKLIDLEDETDDSDPVFWSVNRITLGDVNVNITSEHLLPDGFLNVKGLQADLTAGMESSGFYATLRSLAFGLEEARLPEPVDVYLSASADGGRYTLEELVINTGRTLMSAEAGYHDGFPTADDAEIEAEAGLSPLSWRDVAAYVQDLPLQQDLQMELSASGRLSDLTLALTVRAEGLNYFNTEAGLAIGETTELRRLLVNIEELDAPLLTGIEDLPLMQSLSFSAEGLFDTGAFEQAALAGTLSLSGFRYDEYNVDNLDLDYSLADGEAGIEGSIVRLDENIRLRARAAEVWSDRPQWEAELRSENLNLATWLSNPELESRLNITADVQGEGISPDDFELFTDISISDSRFGDQPFNRIAFTGDVDPVRVKGLFSVILQESEMLADLDLTGWQENDPSYQFELALREFNTAELAGLEDFPTNLNGTLKGEGSGFEPERMRLTATAAFDSSFVNREKIQTLRADFRVQDALFFMEDALLESPIADASLSVRQHIIDFEDAGNTLNFDAVIKDLQPLAVLFGFETLSAGGTVTGAMARGDRDVLQFDAALQLTDVEVDTLFSSEKLAGSLTVWLFENPEVNAELDLTEPVVNDIGVQDISLFTRAVIEEEEISGRLGFRIVNGDISALRHEGDFRVAADDILLRTDVLDFTTDLRTLSLQDPFDITYSQEILRVDTLTILSPEDNAYMSLWVPHADTIRQHAGVDAANLNLGALQTTFIGETFFEGIFSGRAEFQNEPDNIEVSAVGLLSGFEYENGLIDSVRFDIDLADEWLNGNLRGWNNDTALFSGSLTVPFLPGDPLAFDEQFFDRDVSGYFELFDTDLTYWFTFLPEDGFEETDGRISFRTDLAGQAGNPELDGKLGISSARFSGLRVDSLRIDIGYQHETEKMNFAGFLNAQQARVLDFDAELPFKVDLREAEILLPDDDDEVSVNMRTEDFNLAFFSDFVDRELVRQLGGRLNGQVSLTGPIADLQPRGRMELTQGNMRVVPAGITLTEIGAIINFEPDRVELQQFTMRSGPGRMRANGFVEIENLVPGNMQLNITGNQFRAANTSDYNAIIDLTAAVTGSFVEPRLTGNLTFLSGFVNLQNFGERAVEDVQLEEEEEPEPFEFYDNLAMEMNVRFARQFFIRNRQYLDMEIELGGDVDLVKERSQDLQMFGSLEGVRGYARPLGRNFTLDDAVVSFFGPVDNPELNVVTVYEPPQAADVRILYIIEGTVQDPEFRFESEPQMELQDIISYTLFGKPFYELESWEQVVAGTGSSPTAADFALDVLLDRVEMLASQRLGIDVVQIDNTRSGSNSTTSIKTGWYLNRRTFFAILNEISSTRPRTLFMLEYLLMDNLELIITQGDDSREGVDLRWKFDY
jgi:autotransporter translocation and assembly factor TamB